MILTIADWKLDIDLEATMEYSASEAREHCTCAYCRNFYASVDAVYPELRPFLAQFGLDIVAPDELMPFDAHTYGAYYGVSGRILKRGSMPLLAGDHRIEPESAAQAKVNTWLAEPYFFLYVSTMCLPWVLEEQIEEVVSPANEPSFLKKMWSKLLGRAGDTPKS